MQHELLVDNAILNADVARISSSAAAIRDRHYGRHISYSRKVFIALTHLCRDVCHYCTFAKRPRQLKAPYLTIEEVLAIARQGAVSGCKEALFTLGEKPELRYADARDALDRMGYTTTIDYVVAAASEVLKQTGLIPHINAGCLSREEIERLRPVAGSIGLMLETSADRLGARGMPHHGSPDKDPALRLETLQRCGEASIPVTTGILVGIGETRQERLDALYAIDALHARYGHVQEVIVQNFRAKPDTRMADVPDASVEELLWTIAAARLVLSPDIGLQAPPNLNPDALEQLIDAGINDLGGISPVTPDHVNPEAPWPELVSLAERLALHGGELVERLTVYPSYVRTKAKWVHPAVRAAIDRASDAQGYAREDAWMTGRSRVIPWAKPLLRRSREPSDGIARILAKVDLDGGTTLHRGEVEALFTARGRDALAVCQTADELRRAVCGDEVTYVVNRNINYTNICAYHCKFCGFSKGRTSEALRGKPYTLDLNEVQRRVVEAKSRGATEVCLQGGIHPEFTGHTYLSICAAVREAAPGIHIHAFSPLEIHHGAATLGMNLHRYLELLAAAGLNTLPGTAAEILSDDVRAVICPDKLTTQQWLDVMRAAHGVGLRSTATIMFGHVDSYGHWADHLLRVRALQDQTDGFTEFVPLPFVPHEAPMFLKGASRAGPTFREAMLMHAVARIVLHGAIHNIQASWVKLGGEGVACALGCGANDFGGTLMDESITRASGGAHGQEFDATSIRDAVESIGRRPVQRTTLYGRMPLRSNDLGRSKVRVRIPVVAA